MDLENRDNIFVKNPQCRKSEPVLHKRAGFDNHVIGRYQPGFSGKNIFPDPCCLDMAVVSRV